MNKKLLIPILALIAAGLIGINQFRPFQSGARRASSPSPSASQPNVLGISNPAALAAAHYESPPSTLASSLLPEKFSGQTREPYQAAKEHSADAGAIAMYCHCDRGMGHKSLHSCFEHEHAPHCATCIDEALLAYRLQKEGLSAAQIRKQIIPEFGD